VALAMLAALLGALTLATIDAGSRQRPHGETAGAHLVILFLVLVLAYYFAQRLLIGSTTRAVEDALNRTRVRLAGKVAHLGLRQTEDIPAEQLRAGLARHYEAVSQSMVPIVSGASSAMLSVLTALYLVLISPAAAALTFVVLLVSARAYVARGEAMRDAGAAAAKAEIALLGDIEELLDGAEAIRLDRTKRDAVLHEIEQASGDASRQRGVVGDVTSGLIAFGSSIAYLLAGAVVFVLPELSSTAAGDMPRLVAVVLFMLGPVGGMVTAVQPLSTANQALRSLIAFEAMLDDIANGGREREEAPMTAPPPVTALSFRGLRYTHRSANDEAGFVVGPFDLDLRAGEIVFMTGGNGSGKTTALRLITGLYRADQGTVLADGVALEQPLGYNYRAWFSAVFANPHVFRRPYGLRPERLPVLRAALDELGIAQKLPPDLGGHYDPRALSTGQRKRLSLALALTEGRPVLILDEWAADQDPEHRAWFYTTLLPRLRAEGTAVLAVTHDDRYFEMADRRYHMEEGRLAQVVAPRSGPRAGSRRGRAGPKTPAEQ
jgi:putative ATP-binding cassette transporter